MQEFLLFVRTTGDHLKDMSPEQQQAHFLHFYTPSKADGNNTRKSYPKVINNKFF